VLANAKTSDPGCFDMHCSNYLVDREMRVAGAVALGHPDRGVGVSGVSGFHSAGEPLLETFADDGEVVPVVARDDGACH